MGWIRLLLNIDLAKFAVPHRATAISSLGISLQKRWCNNKAKLTTGEERIGFILKSTFPTAKKISVQDISGGCGEMYEIHVESTDFVGKRTVQQHKLITNALKDEVTKMHGLRIFTSVPG